MSITVVDHSSPLSLQTRAKFRRSKPGPETELVDWFLTNWEIQIPKGCRLTIFREPRIESGYPDLVLVNWHVATARLWIPGRIKVTPRDLRLMQYLALKGSGSEPDLLAAFGGAAKATLRRLEAAGMVKLVGKAWKASPLARTFAAREIIAVEAKMTHNSVALHQASLNTWFASSSYVLLPKLPTGCQYLETAERQGVGVWVRAGDNQNRHVAVRPDLPRSYASWLFNEWAWRASLAPETSESGGQAA